MKTDIKEFNGIEYLLLIPESKEEIAIVNRFGGGNAPIVGVVREIRRDNKIGKYFRFEIPAKVVNLLDRIPIAHCESCHAPVFWLKNDTTGKTAPIDVTPSENGNCKVYSQTHYKVLAGEGLTNARSIKTALNTSHFFTCPNANKFKK